MEKILLKNGQLFNFTQQKFYNADMEIGEGYSRILKPGTKTDATSIIDISKKYILPGLMDSHTHVGNADAALPYAADHHCPFTGVTEVLDGGTYGTDDMAEFLDGYAANSRVKINALLHIAKEGQLLSPHMEDQRPVRISQDQIISLLECYPKIRGLKVRLEQEMLDYGYAADTIAKACEIADSFSGRRIMVHIGSLSSHAGLENALLQLRPGDIVTHMYQPNGLGLFAKDGTILPVVKELIQKGVLLDTGFGSRQWSFLRIEQMLQEGIIPDLISSDCNKGNIYLDPPCSMIYAWEILSACGLSLSELITRSIAAPKKHYLGLSESELYTQGDIVIMSIRQASDSLTDLTGRSRRKVYSFHPQKTFINGVCC